MSPRRARILAIDDEPDMAESVRRVLARAGHEVAVETDPRRALERVVQERPDLLLTDLRMPGLSGVELMQELQALELDVAVIVLTGHASIDSAVEAIQKGALDYIQKPFLPEELELRVAKALSFRRLSEENRYLREREAARHEGIVGESLALREVLRLVERVAPTESRVLIVGESGTGKELIARTIHRNSARAGAQFLAVNCGALAEGVLDSELFGHEKGAFTGAVAARKGFFESVDQGTLFLDEISETTLAFQTRLLRVLQEGEFMRVGGSRPLRTDVRVIASTNRDPKQAIAQGGLREDLYYRLAVVQIVLPPLRDRREDVAPLAAHFLSVYAAAMKQKAAGLSPEALEALARYAWPGNVRELENVIERALIMADEGARIELEDLPAEFSAPPLAESSGVQEAEREALMRALRECQWNRSLAARRLGIGRRTLYDRLARYGISLRRPS